MGVRRTNASASNDKVVVLGHTRCGFYYFVFFVGYNFHALHLHAEGETELGHEGRVGVDCLCRREVSCQPDGLMSRGYGRQLGSKRGG